MGMFEQVATIQLKVLFFVLLLGNASCTLPANHGANACGEDLYLRVVLAQVFLPLTAIAAAMALSWVRAEASFQGGIGSVAAGWKRRSLRGQLLLAVAFSFAASVLAVVAFQDGCLYRAGCDAAYLAGYYGAGSPMGVLMIGLFALLHGFFAWVAVSKN